MKGFYKMRILNLENNGDPKVNRYKGDYINKYINTGDVTFSRGDIR